jgi:RNA recognition motif-containing protein
VGHLSKLVGDDDLSDMFGEFGAVESINLVPPRGCAYICMNRRQDAAKALKDLNKTKMHAKPITVRHLDLIFSVVAYLYS